MAYTSPEYGHKQRLDMWVMKPSPQNCWHFFKTLISKISFWSRFCYLFYRMPVRKASFKCCPTKLNRYFNVSLQHNPLWFHHRNMHLDPLYLLHWAYVRSFKSNSHVFSVHTLSSSIVSLNSDLCTTKTKISWQKRSK